MVDVGLKNNLQGHFCRYRHFAHFDISQSFINSRFEFYGRKPSKRARNKCHIKAQKLAALVLKSETK